MAVTHHEEFADRAKTKPTENPVYRHKETGTIYRKLDTALDCTDSKGCHEEGRIMAAVAASKVD